MSSNISDPIAQLEQQGDTLARIEQAQEGFLMLLEQLLSRVADLEQHRHGGDLSQLCN